jgi:hypothetical protein
MYKATQNLESTQVMEMQMEHLFILGLCQLFYIVKRYDSTNNWYMYNNKVNPFNETDRPLKADTTESESTIFGGNELDFLSVMVSS